MKGWIQTLTVGLLALLLAGCGDSIDDLMERAQGLQAEGRYESAIADYRAVLQEDADHAEARFGLGEVGVLAGDYAGAEDALRRAARLGIASDRVQPLLATALLRQGKHEEVLRDINPDIAGNDSLRAELLAAHAEAHIQAENPAEAAPLVEQALALDERSLPALVAAARLAQTTNDATAANSYADRALEVEPNSSAALLVKAQVARGGGQLDDAIAAYSQLLELPPLGISRGEQFNAHGQYIETLLIAERIDDARSQAERMHRRAQRHPYPNFLVGLIALQDGDVDRANEHLQRTLSAAPDSIPGQRLMAAVRMEQEQYAQAITMLQRVISATPNDVQARIMLVAALRMNNEERQANRVLAEGIRAAGDDRQAMSLLSRAAGDDIEAVIADLNQMAQTNPSVQRASLGLAQTLVTEGATDPARAMLEQIESDDESEDFTRRQYLVIAALQGGDSDRAMSEARRLVEDYPDNSSAHNLLGGVHLNLQDLESARSAFEEARRLDQDSVQPLMNLGLVAAASGDRQQAIRYLREGLERQPDNVPAMLQLADLHRRGGENSEAERWLNEANRLAPNNLQAALAMARLQLSRGNPEAAMEAADRAVAAAPDNAVALGLQGVARLEAGQPDAALESLTAAQQIVPEEPDLLFQLARAQGMAGDNAAARNTLEGLVRDHPGRLDARSALARLQLQQGDPDAALQTARGLQGVEGGEAEGALLEGHAHSALDDVDSAITAYARAVELGRTEALGPLVANREEAGVERPADPLEQWIDRNPDNPQARFSLGNWYLEREQYEDAARHYGVLADLTDRENAVVLNNLAWLYQQLGDGRALETARAAYSLAPESAAVMDTLGWIYFQTGDVDNAVELLGRAAAAAPDNAEIQYHHGVALAEDSQTDAARDALNRALELEETAAWSDEARAILNTL
ncbi:putative PEP-CTERM system TPR-repeat lipoprotein [Natronocella acetinitrilica]|uniref:PEP-CTERM system TPR-repeat lipoprotein n=1 Tax=Natronocella acetinitrilica TaxID=414046 RepID=A0AAE3KCP2_9GAMM|nr:XrtA/PEP-CTERM system TPR-repeat protein PrsT [Natronocella acetinitrilica]MCP1677165.1 putative PEP-CTERM system TPR-repeat lipoprotein [Natronocella acetinitrilica]